MREHADVLKDNAVLTVTQALVNQSDDGKQVLLVSGLAGDNGGMIMAEKGFQNAVTPAKGVQTPGVQAKKPAISKTPVSKAQPISTLNPYLHGWSIRAKVLSKGPKRTFTNRSGVTSSVFSAELVDEEGTAIEGTFWRDAAEQYFDLLEENGVYTFSRGSVKPANKNYNRTRNDYCLNFDGGSMVEVCDAAIDASAMQTRMEFVAIDQLVAFVDKKAPVDIIGVVSSVGSPTSVKRKSDSTELQRRDVTLVDRGLKSVAVTLWGERADSEGEKLSSMVAAGEHPVVAISSCRVSSYNGVSVSTTMRSNVLMNPDSVQEAMELRSWYDATGHAESISPISDGMATATKSLGKKREYSDLTTIKSDAPATPESKPTYASVNAMFASINPDQTMYYLACPENNRKVVEQGPGAFFCEYDGKTYPTAVRRYIATARIIDSSGEMPVQVFNEQAEILFSKSADALHEVREGEPSKYKALLTDATWSEWTMRIRCQAQYV